jgi:hypothetical protein
MTLSPLEERQLRSALIAQQLVEWTAASPETAGALLQQLALAVRDHGSQAAPGEGAPLATLQRAELDRLLGEAAVLTHDEPRWRAALRDLRAEVEAQCLVTPFTAAKEDRAAL